MSRTETLRRSVAAANEERMAPIAETMERLERMHSDLGERIESLRLAATQAGEDTARAMLPAAEAMSSLIQESRDLAVQMQQSHVRMQQEATAAIGRTTSSVDLLVKRLETSMLRLEKQMQDSRQVALDLQAKPAPGVWGPALAAALVPTCAVLWMAWRFGAMG